MTRVKKWWAEHERIVWLVTVAVGMLAIGSMLTAMKYERILADQRARFSHELSVIASSYAAAMTAKDQLIDDMAKRSQRAAEKANAAAEKATRSTPEVKANPHPELKGWTK